MEKNKYLEVINNKSKVDQGLWDCLENTRGNNSQGDEVGAAGIYPWPPRSYTCSFCKRQFRSAQALGGHMNIHRRDRARLRQYSPPPIEGQSNGQFSFLNLNLELNPNNLDFNTNPNVVSSSSSSPNWAPPPPPSTTTFTSKLPPLFASSTPAASISEMRTWGKKGISQISDPVHKDPYFGQIRATKRLLELEDDQMGDRSAFRKDTNVMKRTEFVRLELEIGLLGEEDEDLDLELRLGYA